MSQSAHATQPTPLLPCVPPAGTKNGSVHLLEWRGRYIALSWDRGDVGSPGASIINHAADGAGYWLIPNLGGRRASDLAQAGYRYVGPLLLPEPDPLQSERGVAMHALLTEALEHQADELPRLLLNDLARWFVDWRKRVQALLQRTSP